MCDSTTFYRSLFLSSAQVVLHLLRSGRNCFVLFLLADGALYPPAYSVEYQVKSLEGVPQYCSLVSTYPLCGYRDRDRYVTITPIPVRLLSLEYTR